MIQKSLVRIWLKFLKEEYHKNIFYFLLHHVLSQYEIWDKSTRIFSSILISWLVHIFGLQKSIVKSVHTLFSKTNYTCFYNKLSI